MSDNQNLGVSLVLALSDLGNCDDCSYMETGTFELFGETEEGADCSVEVDIADMCTEAATRIQELEKQSEAKEKEIAELVEAIKSFGEVDCTHKHEWVNTSDGGAICKKCGADTPF